MYENLFQNSSKMLPIKKSNFLTIQVTLSLQPFLHSLSHFGNFQIAKRQERLCQIDYFPNSKLTCMYLQIPQDEVQSEINEDQ